MKLELAAMAAAATLAAPALHAQASRKVYISVDMEGISGISGSDQLSSGAPEFGRSRKLMAEDANAAIRGALAAGAGEVVVNDSHGSQRNLMPEDLHPGASLISHSFKRHGMMEGLDESFDAVLFIGYHAKAETPAGLFAHTGSGVLRDVQVNGRSLGEGGLNTMVAEWYGVPVVLVSGDDVAVAEVRDVAKTARGVIVKRALNVRAVQLKSLAVARKEIEDAAREAVKGASRLPPKRAGTYRVAMRFRDTLIPEIAEAFPSIERTAPDSLAFTANSMPDAYRLIRVLYRFINPD